MAMFSSGAFKTSTPLHQQHDSGFYENSPQSRNLSQTSAAENLESNHFPLRKNLFGKRRSNSENIPDHKFSHKHKLLLSKSTTFSRRDTSSNKETPRTAKSCASLDKPVQFAGAETPRQAPRLFLNSGISTLKQLPGNDSGFFGETPERSRSPELESHRVSLFERIENFHQGKENPKEESLAYFKHSLNESEAKNYADLSSSEILRLYYIYRFQRLGLKPSAADIDFCEKHLPINEMNEESEIFFLWKNRLECISAGLEKQPKIDFLSQLQKLNLYSLIYNILSHLSGQDLQSASSVSQIWQKLVFKDEITNATRLYYLKERRKLRKEREKKLADPFQRPQNFRILGNIENIQQKEQLQLKKTIKEINFDAFIELDFELALLKTL